MGRVNCRHFRPIGSDNGGGCAINAAGEGKTVSHGYCMKVCPKRDAFAPRDLVIRNFQGIGDAVLLTATLRDLHAAHPGYYRTGVETHFPAIYQGNPNVTPREAMKPDVEVVKIEGFLPGQDELHIVSQYARVLGRHLGVEIPTTRLGGEVFLNQADIKAPPPVVGPYWVWWVGGHLGLTTKWWDPREAQKVVNHFKGKVTFVQVGAADHWHPKLDGTVYLVGQADLRRTLQILFHAQGSVSGISFGMHLAAAMPQKVAERERRAHVVIAGGRETVQIIQYPGQQVISEIGRHWCCHSGACWKNTCHSEGGRKVDCLHPVTVTPELSLAKCMTAIKASRVIDAIEGYIAGDVDVRRREAARGDVEQAAAEELRPICQACPEYRGVTKDGRVVYCNAKEACCGSDIGLVQLTVSSSACPLAKWACAKTRAWEKWFAADRKVVA